MEDRITIRFPDGVRHEIKIISAIEDVSMNTWVVQTIQKAIKEKMKNESCGYVGAGVRETDGTKKSKRDKIG